MSRTRREIGYKYYRRPRGHKQARVSEARHVPPSAWEDQIYASLDEFYKPILRTLQSSIGKPWNTVASHIRNTRGAHALQYARSMLGRGRFALYIDDNGILQKGIPC